MWHRRSASRGMHLFLIYSHNHSKKKFNWAFLTKLFTSTCFSCVFWLHIGWLSLSFHTCPIHPNCCNLSTVLNESSHWMSNHALTYHKSKGISNMWNYHGMPEVESCINIPEVEGCTCEQWVKMSHMVQEHNNMNLPHS